MIKKKKVISTIKSIIRSVCRLFSFNGTNPSFINVKNVRIPSIIHKNDMNIRCKVKGKSYCEVKDLRGNYRNNLYRILELRKENDRKKYNDYFKYYPEYKKDDYFLSSEIKNLVNDILDIYNRVKKDKIFMDIPPHLKTPIYELHQFFKSLMSKWTEKKEKGEEGENNELRRPSINYRGIHIYFLKLPLHKQYFLLKRNLEYRLFNDDQ